MGARGVWGPGPGLAHEGNNSIQPKTGSIARATQLICIYIYIYIHILPIYWLPPILSNSYYIVSTRQWQPWISWKSMTLPSPKLSVRGRARTKPRARSKRRGSRPCDVAAYVNIHRISLPTPAFPPFTDRSMAVRSGQGVFSVFMALGWLTCVQSIFASSIS